MPPSSATLWTSQISELHRYLQREPQPRIAGVSRRSERNRHREQVGWQIPTVRVIITNARYTGYEVWEPSPSPSSWSTPTTRRWATAPAWCAPTSAHSVPRSGARGDRRRLHLDPRQPPPECPHRRLQSQSRKAPAQQRRVLSLERADEVHDLRPAVAGAEVGEVVGALPLQGT